MVSYLAERVLMSEVTSLGWKMNCVWPTCYNKYYDDIVDTNVRVKSVIWYIPHALIGIYQISNFLINSIIWYVPHALNYTRNSQCSY